MNLYSLGRQTDLIFARFSGEVIDRGNYILIKTPSNPSYHWGNYIIFNRPPQKGDLNTWKKIFDKEFDYYQEPHHYVFTWDSDENLPKGEYEEFLKFGFELDRAAVLTANQVVMPKSPNKALEIRKIEQEKDWQDVIENQVLCADSKFDNDGYKVFKTKQFAEYRKMSKAGLGNWFGAYHKDQLVGDLGIFYENDIGRFQNVCTHPAFRRQGICATLVYETAKFAFKEYEAKTLVMEADIDYHAARIYESVGFEKTEINNSLSWWKGN